jgi:undecaprenyl pyrophosphate phosphatase UppP
MNEQFLGWPLVALAICYAIVVLSKKSMRANSGNLALAFFAIVAAIMICVSLLTNIKIVTKENMVLTWLFIIGIGVFLVVKKA